MATAPGARSLANSAGAAGAVRMRSRAVCFIRCHAGPSNHASFWKPNVRARPGARSAAISAASTAIVPLPHIGSRNGTSGVQPVSATQAGREVLAQRRLVGVAPVAALEQRLAGRVDVDGRVAVGQVHGDAHVGLPLVDRGPHAGVVAQPVAHGVLHAQRRELEALQRRTLRGDVDAQRARGREVAPSSRSPSPGRRARARRGTGRRRRATARGSRCAIRDSRGTRDRARPRSRRRRRRPSRPSRRCASARPRARPRARAGKGRRSGWRCWDCGLQGHHHEEPITDKARVPTRAELGSC